MTAVERNSIKTFDFRQPCRLAAHVEKRFLDWQRRACRLLPPKWSGQLSIVTSCTCPSPETLGAAQAELPEHVVTFRLEIDGQEAASLLCIPADVAAAIVQSALGQSVEALEPARPITSIEVSILELAVADIAQALNEGGVGAGYPAVRLGPHLPSPILIQRYPAETELVYLRYDIKFPFGQGTIYWIWPGSAAETRFTDALEEAEPSPEFGRQLTEVVQRIPLTLRVHLGKAQLHVSELANLAVGDVLVLDQRITEPLECSVEDRPVARAWPGVSGNRQAIQVDHTLPG